MTPPIEAYSPEVQARAADELEALSPPCPRDVVIEDCSVVHRFVLDYRDLRRRIRAAGAP